MFPHSARKLFLCSQVQALNMSLSDRTSAMQELQEHITQLQRALTSSEHDRRVLQDRLDTTRSVGSTFFHVSNSAAHTFIYC